jgi:uncharacterized protein YwgA
MRTELDKLFDAPLLLYIMQQSAPIYSRTKLQKVTFLTELHLRDQHLIGPHFPFIRYQKGPFSGLLWNTFDELGKKGFLHKSTFGLTDRGKFLLDLVIPELKSLPQNQAIFQVMDRTLHRYKEKNGGELIKQVYDLIIEPDDLPGEEMRIEDIPLGLEILVPASGGLDIPLYLQRLVHDELELTNEELGNAIRNFPVTEQQMLRNLTEALNNEENENQEAFS